MMRDKQERLENVQRDRGTAAIQGWHGDKRLTPDVVACTCDGIPGPNGFICPAHTER